MKQTNSTVISSLLRLMTNLRSALKWKGSLTRKSRGNMRLIINGDGSGKIVFIGSNPPDNETRPGHMLGEYNLYIAKRPLSWDNEYEMVEVLSTIRGLIKLYKEARKETPSKS